MSLFGADRSTQLVAGRTTTPQGIDRASRVGRWRLRSALGAGSTAPERIGGASRVGRRRLRPSLGAGKASAQRIDYATRQETPNSEESRQARNRSRDPSANFVRTAARSPLTRLGGGDHGAQQEHEEEEDGDLPQDSHDQLLSARDQLVCDPDDRGA